MLETDTITIDDAKVTIDKSTIEVELDFYKAQRVMLDAMEVWWRLWIRDGNGADHGRGYLRAYMEAATKGKMLEGVDWESWSHHA